MPDFSTRLASGHRRQSTLVSQHRGRWRTRLLQPPDRRPVRIDIAATLQALDEARDIHDRVLDRVIERLIHEVL